MKSSFWMNFCRTKTLAPFSLLRLNKIEMNIFFWCNYLKTSWYAQFNQFEDCGSVANHFRQSKYDFLCRSNSKTAFFHDFLFLAERSRPFWWSDESFHFQVRVWLDFFFSIQWFLISVCAQMIHEKSELHFRYRLSIDFYYWLCYI